MERHELEQRLRASLQERAGDVEPTPTLWQRVEEKAMRRNRWRISVMALGAAAAVAVAVLAVPALLDGPFRVDDVPPVATPTEPQVTQTEPGPGGDDSLKPFLVVTDGAALYLDNPVSGSASGLDGFGALDPNLAEPWDVVGLAVRPGSTVDDLTIATSFVVEGNREISVHRFVDGAAVETYRLGTAALAGQEVADPTVQWSDDGRFLAWTSFADNGGETEPTLRVLTWARATDITNHGTEAAALDGMTIPAVAMGVPLESSAVTATELRLQDWTGPTATLDDQSTLWFTTIGAQAASMTVTFDAPGACISEDGTTIIDEPTCPQVAPLTDVEEVTFEAGAIADVGHEPSGTRYVLAVRSSASQDAEDATMTLQIEPDSDEQRFIELPEEMVPGGAAPGERWLEVIPGGPLVVGVGTQAWILQIPDGAIENTPRGGTITPTVRPLPGIIAVAGGHPGVTTTP